MKKLALGKGDLARMACGIVALGLVVAMLVFIPVGPRRKFEQSKAELDQLRRQLRLALDVKESELARLRSQEELTAKLQERNPNFDLWSFVNTVLKETELKSRANLDTYKSRTERQGGSDDVSMVQLRLSGASLSELVDLFHKVYADENLVVVHKLEYIKPGHKEKGLECSVVFLSPKA